MAFRQRGPHIQHGLPTQTNQPPWSQVQLSRLVFFIPTQVLPLLPDPLS